MISDIESCIWCTNKFEKRKSGGHEQRFCSPGCRHVFHSALQTWARREFESGRVSIEGLWAVKGNPKKPARDKFVRACKRGADPEKIIAGTKVYAERVKAGHTPPKFVAQAVTWCKIAHNSDPLRGGFRVQS